MRKKGVRDNKIIFKGDIKMKPEELILNEKYYAIKPSYLSTDTDDFTLYVLEIRYEREDFIPKTRKKFGVKIFTFKTEEDEIYVWDERNIIKDGELFKSREDAQEYLEKNQECIKSKWRIK